MADGKITFDTAVDNSGLKSGLNQSKSMASAFKGTVAKLGKAAIAAVSIGAIVNFGKKAIELGSNVAEVQNVVDTAFGNMSYKIEEFAGSAVQNFGMSQLSAKKTASTYMAMAKSMGLEEGAASDMAISLTGLTGDVASFYNISQELADTKLKSVFTGETETLKELGVVMTQTNLNAFAMANGYGKTIDKMTQAEAVQLRYAYVTNQLRLASGDFVKTQDSWANQTRILSEQWKELMSVIGQGLITVLAPLVKTLNTIVSYLIKVATAATSAMEALFGKQPKNTAAGKIASDTAVAVENQEALTAATNETGKAAKNASLGMDELNVISKEGTNGSSSSFAVSSIKTTVENPENKESKASSGFISGILELSKLFENIDFSKAASGFQKLSKPFEKLGKIAWKNISWGIENVTAPLTKFAAEEGLPRFFETLGNSVNLFGSVVDGLLQLLVGFYEEFLLPIAGYTAPLFLDMWDNLNGKIEHFTTIIEESEAWEDLHFILSTIYDVLEPIIKALIDVTFWVSEFVMNNAWIDLEFAFKQLEDTIGAVADVIRGDFEGAWGHLEDLLINNKIDNAKKKFDNLKESVGKITDKFKEVSDQWGEDIANWWQEDVEPWFTIEKWNSVIQGMVDSFAEKWNSVYDFFDEELPKWWDDNISPWFTKSKWKQLIEDAINGIKQGWTGFTDFFTTTIPNWWKEDVKPWFTKEKWESLGKSAIRGLINPIIDGLNGLIEELNKFSINIPEIKGITKGFVFGFNIPKIPKLAQGAVIPPNREFLAVLGDQKSGTNIETPLDTMIQAFKTALADGGYAGGETVVNLTAMLDGDVIYRNQERIRQLRGTKTVLTGTFAR